jgi:hypothetical protein
MVRFPKSICSLLIAWLLASAGCGQQLKDATSIATNQILLDVGGAKAEVAQCQSGNAQNCDEAVARLRSIETTAANLQKIAK